MIFYGDIAIPDGFSFATELFPDGFFAKKGFANLEGPISPDNSCIAGNIVFNSNTSIRFLKEHSIIGVSLANNHINDLGKDLSFTKRSLLDNGISFIGYDKLNSFDTIRFEENGRAYIVIACGWDVIGCHYSKKNREGVVPLESDILRFIKEMHSKYADSSIVVFPHWNYELKELPLPMQRELARRMIDSGASFVIGCHPHCCGGIEKYNNGYIAYSLGNFYFVSDKYMNGRLRFPAKSETELAIEIDNGEIILHWLKYCRDSNVLYYDFSEKLDNSSKIKEFTPYKSLTNKEYVRWYKKNRGHTLFLPAFNKMSSPANWFKKRLLFTRQLLIKILWKTGIKKRRSNSE